MNRTLTASFVKIYRFQRIKDESGNSGSRIFFSILFFRFEFFFEKVEERLSSRTDDQKTKRQIGILKHRKLFSVGTTTQTPPTTTPPIPTQCLNGGTLLNANTSIASCFCPVLFTGPMCDQPLCMNGASLVGGTCNCQQGFTGANCQNGQIEIFI